MSLRLNFRHLEMFRLLVRTRNLTETARQLRVSQPAISQALRELEGQLGLTLFVRGNGGVRATSEAIDLLPAVDRLFGQVSVFTSKADLLKDARGGRLEIATIPALAMAGLPRAITEFRRKRPLSHIHLQSLTTPGVIAAVREESVNIGFVATPIQDPNVGAEPLVETELCCFLPADHRLAKEKDIRVDQLDGETLITLSTQSPPGQAVQNVLSKAKKESIVAIETNTAFAALALVEAGAGIAVIDPLPVIAGKLDGIAVRPFKPSLQMTIAAVFSRHRPLTKVELRFIEIVRETLLASNLPRPGARAT